ncbi:MAG: glycosyltransferase, partial [Nitrospirota bacterium]|nr:glycosyltransferase [Nitrospirota bacterium]
RIINEAMIEALPHLKAMRAQLSIVHQTGEADHDRVRSAYEVNGFTAEVVPFLFDMPRALRSATLVVSRSGAVTVAELTACGKPAVLVPLPHAIYQHQEQNARVLEEAGAAVVLRQDQVSGMKLAQVIDSLFRDPGRLQAMGEGSRTLARTDAAEVIVRECMALVKKRSAVSDQPTAER